MGVVMKNKKNQYGMVTLANREWFEKPNKIKVIDLYNMIANGEELPKRFKYDNLIWNKAVIGDNWFNENLMLWFSTMIDTSVLNNEIEIIETEEQEKNNKIEKLNVKYTSQIGKIELANKIDEIIDKINEMSGNNEH